MARSESDDGAPEPRDRAVIVSVTEPDAARTLAAQGAAVVVVGHDGAAVGALVRNLVDAGHRAAAFVGDAVDDAAALDEMVAELLPERAPDGPEPA